MQAVALAALIYPVEQRVGDWPALAQDDPAGQAVQLALLARLYEPLVHERQLVEAVGLYVPAEQVTTSAPLAH